ncbi:hypothetical protein ASG40_20065 [Methylobacterium sp. Leaf399]|nr:hypothetical protein ASG40_20065 [Methylobacterium sp. Leaf399]
MQAILIGRLENDKVVLSFSHDDYMMNIGGVQNVISDESAAFRAKGVLYLHLSPAVPMPMLSPVTQTESYMFSVRVNDTATGFYSATDVIESVTSLIDLGFDITVLMHHLMGHSPEVIDRLLIDTGITSFHLWVHDFFTLCNGYNLLRNNVVFCNAPAVTSGGCGICCYGEGRLSHIQRIQSLILPRKVTLLAPSGPALRNFLKLSPLQWSKAIALPLSSLERQESASPPKLFGKPKLKIAFIGYCNYHKGWHVFQNLAVKNRQSDLYDFVLLTSDIEVPTPGNVEVCEVRVTRNQRTAMIDALVQNEIDVVINWPMWPETFNYALFETFAAGVFVVTNQSAGNVTESVRQAGSARGRVLSNEEDLNELFDNREIFDLVHESDRTKSKLIHSSGSAEVIYAS